MKGDNVLILGLGVLRFVLRSVGSFASLRYAQDDGKKCFMERGGCVYIITNKNHTVLYIGVTSDLRSRIDEHQQKRFAGSFSARYNCEKLIWYECYGSIEEAIVREKFLKGKKRDYKIALIEQLNPEWKDLWNDVKEW